MHRFLAPVALCLALAAPAVASDAAETAARTFDQGLVVLSKGDFDGALKAFQTAARTDPENQNYRMHVALVYRVKQFRGTLEKEADPAQWAKIAEQLRSFYADFDVHGEALALDVARHARLCTTATAVDLAESQLQLSRNADAVKVLSALAEEKASERSRVLLGIALARTGERARAQEIAAKHGSPETDDVKLVFDSACLNALVGNGARAAGQLTLVFERTPPGRLERMKSYARGREDLAALRAAEFEKVWKVASKVKAGCGDCSSAGTGACSSGSGSGGCDMGKTGGGCDEEKGGDCKDHDE